MKSEPAIIIGILLAIVNAIVTVAGLGQFDDGLQWADLIPIIGPILASSAIRQYVWSPESVNDLIKANARRPAGQPKIG